MAIGIVRGLIGKVTVTDAKGSVRELRVGDAVELNDNVQASAGGTVHIVFNNGNFATVGSHDTLILSEAVIDPTGAKAQVAEGQSVADIQAMIAAGMDPTQIAEATAELRADRAAQQTHHRLAVVDVHRHRQRLACLQRVLQRLVVRSHDHRRVDAARQERLRRNQQLTR